ncbi:MAG: sensor domain-containing diguanylate cyclase [Thermodesulfovibrionales bacterium]|nr:sensor domain-containing diguanylate cyclase [Thermodesulfovibrionales bacterium]
MDIEKIFKTRQDIISTYFDNSSSLAIILIDENKKILDCNKGFIRILGLREKPVNSSIHRFLLMNFDEILSSNSVSNMINLVFKGTGNIEILLKGSIFPLDGPFLMIFEQHRLTYNELITKMSQLNDQIVDITRQLEKKNMQLSEALKTIKKIINTDPLTGIMNRRAFAKILKREVSFARRHGLPLSVVMVDIDHFKGINDTYGHDMGDYVLKTFAKTIIGCMRQEDIFARFGGEEFVLILPSTPIESALHTSERLRQRIEKKKIRGLKARITASFGITTLLPTDTYETFLKRADDALYCAKRMGRNRCIIKEKL